MTRRDSGRRRCLALSALLALTVSGLGYAQEGIVSEPPEVVAARRYIRGRDLSEKEIALHLTSQLRSTLESARGEARGGWGATRDEGRVLSELLDLFGSARSESRLETRREELVRLHDALRAAGTDSELTVLVGLGSYAAGVRSEHVQSAHAALVRDASAPRRLVVRALTALSSECPSSLAGAILDRLDDSWMTTTTVFERIDSFPVRHAALGALLGLGVRVAVKVAASEADVPSGAIVFLVERGDDLAFQYGEPDSAAFAEKATGWLSATGDTEFDELARSLTRSPHAWVVAAAKAASSDPAVAETRRARLVELLKEQDK